MKSILISSPTDLSAEIELVNALFEESLACFHLRKPDYSRIQTEHFLKQIKPAFLKRVVLHQHYELLEKYNLKGIHLKEDAYKAMKEEDLLAVFSTAQKRRITVSLSMHQVEDLPLVRKEFAYTFLSPVFDSISKSGYRGNATLCVPPGLKAEVLALGGITLENLDQLSEKGFAGFAILGTIWKPYHEGSSIETLVELFRKIEEKGKAIAWNKTDLSS